jgi:hypothetical protein
MLDQVLELAKRGLTYYWVVLVSDEVVAITSSYGELVLRKPPQMPLPLSSLSANTTTWKT